jgi:four helix bundle protein
LDAYEVAVQFVTWRGSALQSLPKSADIADQLTRAATSIVLNIAEAAGEQSGPERLRFFRMARRSATECDGILDVALALHLDRPEKIQEGRALLTRVLSMLAGLTRPR